MEEVGPQNSIDCGNDKQDRKGIAHGEYGGGHGSDELLKVLECREEADDASDSEQAQELGVWHLDVP